MNPRLRDNITSAYVEAANRLRPKGARRKIVAYVESYDDILFWRTALDRFEDDTRYFEVMLPARGTLKRGKKSVLMSIIGQGVGPGMIACVDADYDYLLQGATPTSRKVIRSPYVFHTYVYAIENYQCYAPSLHNVSVMVALNDHAIFNFNAYLRQYSEAIFKLFAWSVWAYRTGHYTHFSLTDFCRVAETGPFSLAHPQRSLDNVRRKAERKVKALQKQFPKAADDVRRVEADLLRLGVTPQTTYLYIQGHHLFDNVVAPIMGKVCNQLRSERESEIYRTAAHHTQMRNEISCYENSIEDIRSMLRKNMGYVLSPQFQKLQDDIAAFLGKCGDAKSCVFKEDFGDD